MKRSRGMKTVRYLFSWSEKVEGLAWGVRALYPMPALAQNPLLKQMILNAEHEMGDTWVKPFTQRVAEC